MAEKSKQTIVVEITTTLPLKVVEYLCKDRKLGPVELLALLGCEADFAILNIHGKELVQPQEEEDSHEI